MGLFDSLVFKVGADTSPFQREMNKVQTTAKRVGTNVAAALKVVGGAAAAAAAGFGAIGAAAIKTGAEFETLEARLSTLLGSASAGRQRMEELFEVATTTPFNLSELVEAEATLEGFGVNAEEMRGAVMDLSGALGLSLTDAAGAVGRAFAGGAGAADILRERGVLAMVELRTGIKATEMSAKDFQQALTDTLTDPDGKIAGGTARLASTFKGTLSNLQDELTKFRKAVSDAGLFEGVKRGARELLNMMEENRGAIDAIADSIGFGLLAGLQMAIRGVGYLAEGFNMARLAVATLEESTLAAAATIGRFVESQIRDFEGLYGALETAADAMGLDTLSDQFATAERGFKGTADSVAGRARAMEDGAAAAAAEVDALTESVGDYLAEANRLVAATNQRGGGIIADAGAGEAPQAVAPGGDSGGGATALSQEAMVSAIQAATEAEDGLNAQRERANDLEAQRAQLMQSSGAAFANMQEREAASLAEQQERLRAIHEERVALAAGDYNEQIRLYEQFLNDQVDLTSASEERMGMIRAQAYASAAGNISAAARDLSQVLGEQNEDAALKAFRVSQAAGMIQATISTAVAATKALELGPVAGPIAAAAIGAAGAAQIALIASQPPPTFDDTPGVVQVSSSGGTVNFGGNDFVAAGKDPDDLRRQVDRMDGRDRRSGREMVPVMPVFEGRTWERGTQDQTRRPGPLRDAIRGSSTGAVGRSGF